MDGISSTGSHGQDYSATDGGSAFGQPSATSAVPTGNAATAQPETNLVSGGPGAAASVPEKRSLTDKVKGLLGGNKNQTTSAGTAAAESHDTSTGAGTTATSQAEGVDGDTAGVADANVDTQGAGSKVGFLDKIKAKVGMGHAGGAGVPDSELQSPQGNAPYDTNGATTPVGHHTGPAAAAGAAGGRSESSPYDSAGVGPTSGTNPGSGTDSAPTDLSAGYDQRRSESSPYDSAGAAPTSVTQTGSAPQEPTGYGQEHGVRTESSPYDTAGANPEYLTKNQAGGGGPVTPTDTGKELPGGGTDRTHQGGATFTDSQGNVQEGPRDDNVKKEGLMSKLMDKLHQSPST